MSAATQQQRKRRKHSHIHPHVEEDVGMDNAMPSSSPIHLSSTPPIASSPASSPSASPTPVVVSGSSPAIPTDSMTCRRCQAVDLFQYDRSIGLICTNCGEIDRSSGTATLQYDASWDESAARRVYDSQNSYSLHRPWEQFTLSQSARTSSRVAQAGVRAHAIASKGATYHRVMQARRAVHRRIHYFLARFKLPMSMATQIQSMLRQTRGEEYGPSKSVEVLILASLYVLCRQHRRPLSLLDLAPLVHADVYKLGRAVAQILIATNITLPQIEPSVYIARLVSSLPSSVSLSLDQSVKVHKEAAALVSLAHRNGLQLGRKPAGILVAAVTIALEMNDILFSNLVPFLSNILHVSKYTAQDRVVELKRGLEQMHAQYFPLLHEMNQTRREKMQFVLEHADMIMAMEQQGESIEIDLQLDEDREDDESSASGSPPSSSLPTAVTVANLVHSTPSIASHFARIPNTNDPASFHRSFVRRVHRAQFLREVVQQWRDQPPPTVGADSHDQPMLVDASKCDVWVHQLEFLIPPEGVYQPPPGFRSPQPEEPLSPQEQQQLYALLVADTHTIDALLDSTGTISHYLSLHEFPDNEGEGALAEDSNPSLDNVELTPEELEMYLLNEEELAQMEAIHRFATHGISSASRATSSNSPLSNVASSSSSTSSSSPTPAATSTADCTSSPPHTPTTRDHTRRGEKRNAPSADDTAQVFIEA